MALKIMDLFKSIKWAENGDVTDMSQTNYEAGWGHLGDDTPTVEDFNVVQQLNDAKDQWLFNQIKAVCDSKEIAVSENDKQALLKAINTSATLSRAGITQLSSALDSTLETMAATPKAIKTLNDLIDAITRNLENYIPNSKKSDSVTSPDSDTVATSKSVKTAYDKAVGAQNTADDAIPNSKKSNAINSPSSDTVATSAAVKAANDNANGRVSKSGDTMTGKLFIESSANGTHSEAGIAIINKGEGRGTAVHFDGYLHSSKVNKGGMHIADTGDGGAEVAILTTPAGNAGTDRRNAAMIINNSGYLWVAQYGWLHDYFAKQADNNNIWNELNNNVVKRGDLIRTWYPDHYAGTEVYKIRHLGLMITVMNVNGANREIYLPESYDGHGIALAQDRGDGRVSLEGSRFLGQNRVLLTGRNDTNCHVLVIGFKAWI